LLNYCHSELVEESLADKEIKLTKQLFLYIIYYLLNIYVVELSKRVKTNELESAFRLLMHDLKEVRKQVEELTSSKCGLSVYLDKKNPPSKRRGALLEIGSKTHEVTQLKKPLMSIADEDSRIDLGCFSKEFKELEMEIVKIRARIIALKNQVNIKKFEEVEPIGRLPDTKFSPIGTAKDWKEVRKMVRILYKRNCIRYCTAITPDAIHKGEWKAKELKEVLPSNEQDEISTIITITPGINRELSTKIEIPPELLAEESGMMEVPYELNGNPDERVSQLEIPAEILSLLSDIERQLYPDKGIPMFISEIRGPDSSIQKQLIAVKVEKL
jgi:hypothetical protein